MKKTTFFTLGVLVLTIALLTSCKDKDDDPPPETATVPQPTQKTLTFGSVTISSPDQHLPSAWNALCNDVVTALESAYTSAGNASKNRFRTVFDNSAGGEIVLVNNLSNNWEVRDGESGTLYLKTDSIATANYANAVRIMASVTSDIGKATPPKDRAFLG